MIISLSGFDGVGKSTSVELVRQIICHTSNLTGIAAVDANNGSMIYNSEQDLDHIYNILDQYDVISCPFYFRTDEFHTLQNELMNSDKNVFDNTQLIMKIANLAKINAVNWFQHVILKLHNNNKIILFDRYYYDEIAYRSLYNLDKCYMESLYDDFVNADVKIMLAADYDFIVQRNSNREDSKMALFQRKDKMEELLCNLEYVSKKYGMSVINIQNKSKADVANEIYQIIRAVS